MASVGGSLRSACLFDACAVVQSGYTLSASVLCPHAVFGSRWQLRVLSSRLLAAFQPEGAQIVTEFRGSYAPNSDLSIFRAVLASSAAQAHAGALSCAVSLSDERAGFSVAVLDVDAVEAAAAAGPGAAPPVPLALRTGIGRCFLPPAYASREQVNQLSSLLSVLRIHIRTLLIPFPALSSGLQA